MRRALVAVGEGALWLLGLVLGAILAAFGLLWLAAAAVALTALWLIALAVLLVGALAGFVFHRAWGRAW